jgi:hypothetical protein
VQPLQAHPEVKAARKGPNAAVMHISRNVLDMMKEQGMLPRRASQAVTGHALQEADQFGIVAGYAIKKGRP